MERPANCRNRLRDEGKAYPRSGCLVCKDGGLRGCPYEKPEPRPPMTDTIDVAALVERLRVDAEYLQRDFLGSTAHMIGGRAAAAAAALQAQADALAEARREVNKYAYERDKAREERDAAERRSEAFWKPQFDKAAASLATMREALEEWRAARLATLAEPVADVRKSETFAKALNRLAEAEDRLMQV